jgi:hypothetical protein
MFYHTCESDLLEGANLNFVNFLGRHSPTEKALPTLLTFSVLR